MPSFRLKCSDPNTGSIKTFYYDSDKSTLVNSMGLPVLEPNRNIVDYKQSTVFDKDNPVIGKDIENVTRVKIQFGLTCNYSCSYCNQKAVARPDEIANKYADEFIAKFPDRFPGLFKDNGKNKKLELWGGEPLVYWKAIRKIVPAIRKMLPELRLSMISNGSLLTMEIARFIHEYDINLAISHDGPAQSYRGDDPLDKPTSREAIDWLLEHRLNKMSFNPVFHINNYDRYATVMWFKEKLGRRVTIGESVFIEVYNEDGANQSTSTEQMQIVARKLYEDMFRLAPDIFNLKVRRTKKFIDLIKNNKPISSMGMKCGMESKKTITTTMTGDIITCQNTSVDEVAANGQLHKIGNVDDPSNVTFNTGTHWKNRDNCSKCPVISLCQGGCLYIQGDSFETSCNNNYVDNVASLAYAIYELTGTVLLMIDDNSLPPERQDPFGYIGLLPSKTKVRKTIPIKAI